MIESVIVQTVAGASLILPLEDVVNGYIIADVDGLDPVRAVLVSSTVASMDGEQFQSARREARDIKFRIGLEPDYTLDDTVRGLRNRLYTYLMPKSEVKLSFVLEGGLTYDIRGRVETFETALFTKDPEIDIVVKCFDPDFVDPSATVLTGLATVADATEYEIDYDGTVETGIELTMNVNRTLNEFTIYHRPADGTVRTFDFAEPMIAGDVLKIVTIGGSKSVTLTRTGSTTSVLRGKSPQSSWVELQNGSNHLRVYALGAPVPYSIAYTTRYGGL